MKSTTGSLLIVLFGALSVLLAGCPAPGHPAADAPRLVVRVGATAIPAGTGAYDYGEVLADGNDGAASDYVSFTLENAGTADLTISGFALGGSDFDYTQPAVLLLAPSAGTEFIVRFDPVQDGEKYALVTVRSDDPDTDAYTFRLDGTGVGPSSVILINNGDNRTNNTAVALTLNPPAVGAGAAQMMIADTALFTGAAWEDLAASRDWTLASGDGPKTVYVKFADAAGVESAVFSDVIVLDTDVPAAPLLPDLATACDSGLSDSDDVTNLTAGLLITGLGAEPGSRVTLASDLSGPLGEATASATGAWGVIASAAAGAHQVTATATDAAGNVSAPSPALALTVDDVPPATPRILTPLPGKNTGLNRRPTFTWTPVADAARYVFQADDNVGFASPDYAWADLTAPAVTPESDMAAATTVPVGTRYYLRVRCRDTAGNWSPWSTTGGPLRCVNVGRFDGDVNGDGYSDTIVGAYTYNYYQGQASVFFGGSAPDSAADLTFTGPSTSSYFGNSVASAGDVNGDGFADVIVGAHAYASSTGRTFIYLGGSTMDNIADVVLAGETTSNLFGYSVAGAGDVNGDGCDDVIVGAYYHSSGTGRAYVYYGAPSMNNIADLTLTGEATSNNFGRSVSSAGDVNGDGYEDVIVGAYNYSSATGRAYVYYGGAAPDATADLTPTGTVASGYFGYAVSKAGDFNGDGYGDFVVGSPNQRYADFFYGGPIPDASSDLTVGPSSYGSYGQSLCAADVNGDGYDDVVIGAYTTSVIYLGGAVPDGTADVTLTGSNNFGYAVGAPGDFNGDGYGDLIIGESYYDNNRGRTSIFFGGAALDTAVDLMLIGQSQSLGFGCSVAKAGTPDAAYRVPNPSERPFTKPVTRRQRRPISSTSCGPCTT